MRILSYLISGIFVLINLLLENKVGRYNFPPFKIKSGSENRLRTLSADDGEEKGVGLLAEKRERDVGMGWGRRKMRKNERVSPRHRVIYTLSGGKR